VIVHGDRFGWLTFDPVTRRSSLDITPEALPQILPYAKRGILDLEAGTDAGSHEGRIGGKRFSLQVPCPTGRSSSPTGTSSAQAPCGTVWSG